MYIFLFSYGHTVSQSPLAFSFPPLAPRSPTPSLASLRSCLLVSFVQFVPYAAEIKLEPKIKIKLRRESARIGREKKQRQNRRRRWEMPDFECVNLDRSTCRFLLRRISFDPIFRFDKLVRSPARRISIFHFEINFSPSRSAAAANAESGPFGARIYIGARPEFRQLLPMPPPIAADRHESNARRCSGRGRQSAINQSIKRTYTRVRSLFDDICADYVAAAPGCGCPRYLGDPSTCA